MENNIIDNQEKNNEMIENEIEDNPKNNQTEEMNNDITQDENQKISDKNKEKIEFLSQIKSIFYAIGLLSFVSVIVGIIMLFKIEDKTIGIGIIIIACTAFGFGVYRYGKVNENNIRVIHAKCIDKSKSGYRRQYFEYVFEDVTNEENAIVVKTAQKEKFKQGLNYSLCFNKRVDKEKSLSGTDLLSYKII